MIILIIKNIKSKKASKSMKMKIRTIFINIVVFLSLLIGLTICLEVI